MTTRDALAPLSPFEVQADRRLWQRLDDLAGEVTVRDVVGWLWPKWGLVAEGSDLHVHTTYLLHHDSTDEWAFLRITHNPSGTYPSRGFRWDTGSAIDRAQSFSRSLSLARRGTGLHGIYDALGRDPGQVTGGLHEGFAAHCLLGLDLPGNDEERFLIGLGGHHDLQRLITDADDRLACADGVDLPLRVHYRPGLDPVHLAGSPHRDPMVQCRDWDGLDEHGEERWKPWGPGHPVSAADLPRMRAFVEQRLALLKRPGGGRLMQQWRIVSPEGEIMCGVSQTL